MSAFFILTPMKTCWTLSNNSIALQRQTRGVAHALGFTPIEKVARVKKPWQYLFFISHSLKHLSIDSSPLAPPWPDFLIACGYNVIRPAIQIKQLSRRHTRIIYVQDPGLYRRHFDLIIAPQHDHCPGNNVIETLGATHDLTDTFLAESKLTFQPTVAHLPPPYLSIFIGGSNKGYKLTQDNMIQLTDTLLNIAQQYPGSLLISGSRRTGDENLSYLKRQMENAHNVYLYDGQGENPYFGMLAMADTIMITNDSVSMISEACFTGKPVYILPLPNYTARRKLAEFTQQCQQSGYIRSFENKFESWCYQRLDECARITPIAKEKLDIT